MEVVLNGRDVVELEDQGTVHGHQMISCTAGARLNPTDGFVVFIEGPQVGAHPWVAYVRLSEDGRPDLTSRPAARMPLNKSTITSVRP